MNRAEVLDLSAERDSWLARLLASWREGWRTGYADGDAAGARRTAREWHVTVAGLPYAALGPPWAELEKRRWGPGGRAHFADPRPGDYPGGQHG